MYAKHCQGCGRPFEALKANRKWCSDTCGKRTRRQAPPQPRVSIQRTTPAAEDPYVEWHRDFLGVLGESLPAELVTVLTSDADRRDQCTQEQFAAVVLWVSDQFRSAVTGDDWDRADAIVRALQALMDDLVDGGVLVHLAARIADTGSTVRTGR